MGSYENNQVINKIKFKNYNVSTNPVILIKPPSAQIYNDIRTSPYKNMSNSISKPKVTFNSNFAYYPDKNQINNPSHIKSSSQAQFYHSSLNMAESHVQ